MDPINVKYLKSVINFNLDPINVIGPRFVQINIFYFWTNLGPILVTGLTYCQISPSPSLKKGKFEFKKPISLLLPQNSKASFFIGPTITFYY